MDINPAFTPPERAVARWAAEFMQHMPADLFHECKTLAELNPDDGGIRAHRNADGGWDLVWMDIHLGWVSDDAIHHTTV